MKKALVLVGVFSFWPLRQEQRTKVYAGIDSPSACGEDLVCKDDRESGNHKNDRGSLQHVGIC